MTEQIDIDTERIIKELYRFKRRYRKKYVLMILLNFINANWVNN